MDRQIRAAANKILRNIGYLQQGRVTVTDMTKMIAIENEATTILKLIEEKNVQPADKSKAGK